MTGPRVATVDELLDEARATTGLDDLGAPTFVEGLEVLLASLVADTGYDQAALDQALVVIRRRLANRAYVEDWYRSHPEIADQPLAPPVSILGLPRTGTTALGNIVSLDPQFRSLRMWEQNEPVPPPVLGEEATDPRRAAQAAEFDAMIAANPDLASMHLFDVDAAGEDTEVLGLEFKAQQLTFPVSSYHDWWRHSDMGPTYRYHRRIVQLLGSRRPPNLWLFKAPHHKFHLEPLVAAYPDIRLVWTHRDPAKSVPSYASLTSGLYPPGSRPHRDPVWWGRHVANHLREGMEAAVAARERLGDDRFHDVPHHEFVRDPLGTIERIYGFLGLELTAEVRQKMVQWHAVNREGSREPHRYSPEHFGLTADELAADFAFYTERYGHLLS